MVAYNIVLSIKISPERQKVCGGKPVPFVRQSVGKDGETATWAFG